MRKFKPKIVESTCKEGERERGSKILEILEINHLYEQVLFISLLL